MGTELEPLIFIFGKIWLRVIEQQEVPMKSFLQYTLDGIETDFRGKSWNGLSLLATMVRSMGLPSLKSKKHA